MHGFKTIIPVSHGFVRLLAAVGWFSCGMRTSLKSQWTGHPRKSIHMAGIDAGHWLEAQ